MFNRLIENNRMESGFNQQGKFTLHCLVDRTYWYASNKILLFHFATSYTLVLLTITLEFQNRLDVFQLKNYTTFSYNSIKSAYPYKTIPTTIQLFL